MFNLPNYLAKYRQLTKEHSANKEVILKILVGFGFNFKPNQIEVKNRVLEIKTKPIFKSELLLQKKELLTSLQNHLKDQIIDLK